MSSALVDQITHFIQTDDKQRFGFQLEASPDTDVMHHYPLTEMDDDAGTVCPRLIDQPGHDRPLFAAALYPCCCIPVAFGPDVPLRGKAK
ncbi:hypothetical protein EYF80_007281 [Liparis tanakae]|uniref:Uncharacterized protein n=1 Tax=Liparis tanakae TaxID=230148 RepID=A0A4Z2IX45_9TELE|nr:hypothetical protein EYF80_007281 [Liparis tanakae]